MDFRRWITYMRTRTALVLFLGSILAGALLAFALAAVAESSDRPSTKVIRGGAVSSDKSAPDDSTGFRWRDLGAALEEAKQAGRPIVVDVYTDWCGWCRRMDRDTYSAREVRSYLADTFVPVRMNAEASSRVTYKGDEVSYRQVASNFRVTSYPTTVFLDSDGTYIVAASGYMKPRDFLTVLRFIGDGHYKKKSWEQYRDALEQPEPGSGK